MKKILIIGSTGQIGSELSIRLRSIYGADNVICGYYTPPYPEGFFEAFANIYRNFTKTVMALRNGEQPTENMLDFPTVYDGVRGMQFIETMVEAGWKNDKKWQPWIE